MTTKFNQKPTIFVTSFSQTKFSTKDALSRDPMNSVFCGAAVPAAFEDLQVTRLPLQFQLRQASFQIPGSISGDSGGASAATRLVARQRQTASTETKARANQMRRKVMKCWRVNVS
jgi:hypothetical protein